MLITVRQIGGVEWQHDCDKWLKRHAELSRCDNSAALRARADQIALSGGGTMRVQRNGFRFVLTIPACHGTGTVAACGGSGVK